jgi:HAD superfamily phosphoserine phosphatase-like hydrolase
MRAAVFSDVEGTLIDASIPRLALAIGRRQGAISPWQTAQVVGLALLGQALPGRPRRYLQALGVVRGMGRLTDAQGQAIIAELTPQIMQHTKLALVARLREHQAAGFPLILISGGLHDAIVDLARQFDARGEGTKLSHRDGHFIPKLDGPICQGVGKARRTKALFAELDIDPAASYAYGDTGSDIPFLELFGYPHAVDPDAELVTKAQQRGWPIIRTTTGA